MKSLNFFKTFVNPLLMVRHKSMNLIISICIFVITSFMLGLPVGQNKIKREKDIITNYNYNVLLEIPNRNDINSVFVELVNNECKVTDGKELHCNSLRENPYINDISFQVDGITKRVHFVIDLFDIEKVYLETAKVNYDPVEKFTTQYFPPMENTEDYLVIISSDSLYFQAHPHGTDRLMINHNDHILKTESMKIFYQNNIPEFALSMEDAKNKGYLFGNYLIDQLIIGNSNTLKLRSFTHAFLIGVCFTLITVLILWVFFRRNGKIKSLNEYYNIAAISSLPVSFIFFIFLWFIPDLLNIYIFAFSLFYLFSLNIINTSEDLV